jgi:hypothetical protein
MLVLEGRHKCNNF